MNQPDPLAVRRSLHRRPFRRPAVGLAIFVLIGGSGGSAPAAEAPAAGAQPIEIRVTASERGAMIAAGDQPFAEYLIRSGAKPVVWPVFGPGQAPMTRSYPLDPSRQGEAHDHIHQRSLWFSYGSVGGVDFWSENPGAGRIVQRELVELKGGPTGIVVTRNDWLAPDGRKVLEDRRRLVFAAAADARTIDFDIVLIAGNDPVEFGDTKEGAFGLRVAESLAVNKKQGGEIKNDHGETDQAAWGKHASWVDYHGRIDGQPLGIAILNHPASFAYPTRWHVRGYGLFAANPFASKEFGGEKQGGYTLAAGAKLEFFYRVLLHRGDEQTGRVAAAFDDYAREKRP